MAKKTGKGFWQGAVKDRYQQYNPRSDRYDKFDGDGNYVDSKVTPGRFKSVEERSTQKPPRS